MNDYFSHLSQVNACGTKIHVRIDKAAQKKKKVLQHGNLVLQAAPAFEHMMYYLQYGEIISVGEKVTDNIIKPGRIALIHHSIEDEDERLIGQYPNGDDLRWLEWDLQTGWQICAVIDETGELLPLPNFVFCKDDDPNELKEGEERLNIEGKGGASLAVKITGRTAGGIYMATNEALDKRPENNNDIKAHYITTAVAINPEEKQITVGMKVITPAFNRYELDYDGIRHAILLREFIFGCYKNSTP